MKRKIKKKKRGKTKEKDLMHRYRLMYYLLEHIPDVIYFKDRQGKLLLVNQAHAKGLGLKPQEVVGKTDFDLFPKERAAKMFKDDMYVIKKGNPIIDRIERGTRADGVDNYVSTTKIPMYGHQGKVIGLIGITRDITRRMQLEQLRKEKMRIQKKLEVLEEMNKLKSDFVSTVSHELRSPVAIIQQLVMLMFNETAGRINDKQREILRKAKDNTARLAVLIDELLDASRMERDKLKLNYSVVDINGLLKDQAHFFKSLARQKAITLNYRLPNKQVNLFIDADRINQVIANLINNALKFTQDRGTIEVEVRVFGNKVRVGVLDTGVGISASDLKRVFSKFNQARDSQGIQKGVGLGLYIVKELVKRHGGEVWVESKLGVGSKFYFTLPRFYAADILDKRIKSHIESLLKENAIVHLVNLVFVNYRRFKERIKVRPNELFKDLKGIIDGVFQGIYRSGTEKKPDIFLNVRQGKCSIIFTGITQVKAGRICKIIKDKIKEYFIDIKLKDVFLALGYSAYPQKPRLQASKSLPANFRIKEIYIGSEMRRFRRLPYKANIKLIPDEGRPEISQSVDISQGGICLICKKAPETDSYVKIVLPLPEQERPVLVRARVAWIKEIEGRPGCPTAKYKVGLEFSDLKNKDRKMLIRKLKI